MASLNTRIWSATVLDPALPLRRSIDSDSSVLAHHPARGWKPKPFLKVAAAPSLLLCAPIRVASRSMTTQPVSSFPATHSHGNPPGRLASRSHTRRRTFARVLAIRRSAASSRLLSVRRTVESDGGSPNTST